MEDLRSIEGRLARLEARDPGGMGREAAARHRGRVGDLRVEAVRAAIGELVELAAADAWMDAPNGAFGGRTPAEAARADPDAVRQAIRALASGEPG